jgi:uncharacterized membrane protein YkvA (DUF1232 family)
MSKGPDNPSNDINPPTSSPPPSRLRRWARSIKRDVVALWIAARDPRTSWYAKATAGFVAGYALSPIDFIPDFVPILGYLDDLLIVPAGILLAVRLIPPALMAEFRRAAERRARRPASRVAAVAIVLAWVATTAVLLWLCGPGRAR